MTDIALYTFQWFVKSEQTSRLMILIGTNKMRQIKLDPLYKVSVKMWEEEQVDNPLLSKNKTTHSIFPVRLKFMKNKDLHGHSIQNKQTNKQKPPHANQQLGKVKKERDKCLFFSKYQTIT